MARLKDKPHFRKLFETEVGNSAEEEDNISQEVFEQYQSLLPEELLLQWREYGFCRFANGLFWLTNPSDYTELLANYLKGSPFADRKNLYVIAKTAFGQLHIWESKKGNSLILMPLSNMIFFNAKVDRNNLSTEDEEYEMNWFLGVQEIEDSDHYDAQNKPLFERALKKYGVLQVDEMYGYKQSLELGGKEGISNIDKVNLFNYFDIQRQLAQPTVSVSDTENNTLTY